MSNLLSIEAAFLSKPQVKQGMNLQEVTNLQRAIDRAERKSFDNTLTMANLAAKAWQWMSSDEGKALCEEEGVTFTKEALGEKVFKYKKSFFCKLVKAGELSTEVVEKFKAKCDEAESAGERPVRSVESLNKFAKALEQGQESGGQGESGEGEGEGEEGGEPQVETRAQVLFSFTFKNPEGANVAVRIDTDGTAHTTAEKEAVLEAIRLFTTKFKYAVNQ